MTGCSWNSCGTFVKLKAHGLYQGTEVQHFTLENSPWTNFMAYHPLTYTNNHCRIYQEAIPTNKRLNSSMQAVSGRVSMVSTRGPVSSCKVQELSFTIKTSTPSKLRNRPRMDKRDGWENGTTPDSSFQAGFREEGKDMQNIHTVETYETPEVIYVYVCVIVWCTVASS